MAWTNIPLGSITFGVFTGSSPAGATVSVAASDLLLCRYRTIGADTVTIDIRIAKAFFTPTGASVSGITMALKVPFASVYVPAIGAPSSFNDAGQTYSNDCILALDPGGLNHAPGCIAMLNEASRKVVLLIRNVNGDQLNMNGVIGVFGQITFEIAPARTRPTAPRGKKRR